MADVKIIWRGASRQLRITVDDTTDDVSSWTLVARIGPQTGVKATVEKTLTWSTGKLFLATLTYAESLTLVPGNVLVFIVRTNSGSEDVLGYDSFVVEDPVKAFV